MSMRLEMLQVARLAPKVLGESAELVRDFVLKQQNDDGGFRDRAGKSDLYYTVFGLDGLLALDVSALKPHVSSSQLGDRFAQTTRYLQNFDPGPGMDFVHLCCLARAWAAIASQGSMTPRFPECRDSLLGRIEEYRSEDGGYNPVPGAKFGTVYGCFLALGAYQDLKSKLPQPLRLAQGLKFLETADGAWANERNLKTGSTNPTAAATTVLRNLSLPMNPAVGDWLLARAHRDGGFLAAPQAPMPDLLSTATALHALAGLEISCDHVREQCLDFIDTLWTNEGAFHGHWGDDQVDTEYTFYGLLALGHLWRRP